MQRIKIKRTDLIAQVEARGKEAKAEYEKQVREFPKQVKALATEQRKLAKEQYDKDLARAKKEYDCKLAELDRVAKLSWDDLENLTVGHRYSGQGFYNYYYLVRELRPPTDNSSRWDRLVTLLRASDQEHIALNASEYDAMMTNAVVGKIR